MAGQKQSRLTDADLFGNDAAEDEDLSVFQSYVLARPELHDFTSPDRRICIARAYKGEGKSALLRLSAVSIEAASDNPIVVLASATSLAPELPATSDFSAWVRAWKAAIFNQLAAEVGATIGLAWSDDAISLVEQSERQGFKAKNIVSVILSRFNLTQVKAGSFGLSMAVKRLGTSNPEKVLQRWAKDGTRVWLFIDDVDLNFQNTAQQRLRVASFFIACREIVNAVEGLCLRAAVRPNVWTVIKLEFEALSHVEQYAYDLRWSEEAMREMLARRIEAYLKRKGLWSNVEHRLPGTPFERDKALIGEFFDSPMEWSHSTRPPHVILYTLSKRRPRWAVELSKVAARSADAAKRSKISRADIFENLASFGTRRIEDTVAEFRSQCPEIDELISAFRAEKEQFRTDEMLKLIENKVLNHLQPHIVGHAGKVSARDVAAFLFQIGFFFGRRDLPGEHYEHVGFSDQPTLWHSRSDMDSGLSWEIHPVFRQALDIRDAAGREFAPPARKPRRESPSR